MTVGIILAAGLGSRYRTLTGRNKLTDPVPDGWHRHGVPVILASIKALAANVRKITIVVTPDNTELITLLSQTDGTILHIQTDGLGTSLARAVANSPSDQGWLIALGDMPFIQEDTIAQIVGGLTPSTIVAPFCQGRRGHPVGFGADFRQQLLALTGDTGAKSILKATPPRLIQTDDVGTITDIDAVMNLSM